MKKLIAILLVLVMVLPMCLVAQAEDASKEIKPFYMINWSPLPEGVDVNYVYNMYAFWTKAPQADAKELYVYAKDYGIENDIPAIAADMKARFDSRPVGARYMYVPTRLTANMEHYVFLDKGVKLLQECLEKFYTEYTRIGGQLDGLIIDVEYSGYSASNLDKVYQADPFIYKSIVEDPRYQERIRPELERRGFKFWTETNDYQPEIYSINSKTGDSKSRSIWDAALCDLMVWYMEEACSPVFKYYPNANLSNYRSYASRTWIKTLSRSGAPITSGHRNYVGNTTNENSYLNKPSVSYFKASNTSAPTFNYPVTYNKSHLQANKFSALMWDLSVFKDMMLSSDTENMSAWVVGHNYNQDLAHSVANSPYYAENYFHIGMMNPNPFLAYVTHNMNEFADSVQILSDIMDELTRVAGYADRKYIKLPHNWNYSFALTGMYAGGRNIWRITPDVTGDMTLEKFKVEGTKDPTFYIDGQTVTFPGGKIIEDGKIREVGTCGYWVETAADVLPIVTSDKNRYEMFPAFGEDFNGYETGMEYTYNNVETPSSWQIKKGKNATALIQEDKDNAGNKVLAITGDFTMKNAKVTKNITAGDTYAEDQTWQITVTIPANMAADAEAIILSLYGDRNKYLDGGFKVAGGKLYYYNGEKHVEFEGIDVSAGGKFTLKRVMNFNTPKAFTCDYVVYDAAGKELAKVKDVAVNKDVKLPVASIGFEFTKIAGDPILVDDYKLYASGVSAECELYDVELGYRIEEADKARDKDTAYRVSWLNGTAYDKVYSVVAAYYNGDKLVEEKVLKEIKMAPNTDAVETGVVEVAEGQSVRIYVRNDSQPEPVGGAFGVMLIAIIAGAVVLVAVIVVVIVAAGKKKKKDSAAAEALDEKAAE